MGRRREGGVKKGRELKVLLFCLISLERERKA